MTGCPLDLPDPTALTDDAVRALAETAGLRIPPARLPDVAAHLRLIATMAADLGSVDVAGVIPGAGFDPRWDGDA